MSKYISQYDEVVSSDSTDYYLLQRGSAYKKFTKANFFNQISNELGIGVSTLVGLTDVDITYLSNGDVLQYNSSTEMWDCVPMSGGGVSAMDDLTDVTITGLDTNDVISWNGSAYVNNATYARVSSVTTGFIPRSTGTNTFTNGIMTDDGTAVGFNTATYTYSFNFGGNSARSIGLNRHTTSNTAGNTFSHYAGGATSGASDKNGGNYDIYAGIATGNGSSQFNVYTTTAGASGTTDRTPSLKLNVNGVGTMELTTSTANSKLRIGHNLKTILSLTTGIGIDFSRVADGSYTISGGIHMVDNSSYRMIISSANAGVAFVKNPATDTVPFAVIGGSGGGQFWSGVGTGAYPVDFRRVFADANSSTFSYFAQTGTSSSTGNTTTTEIVNTMTNTSGRNFALTLSATSSTTDNIALYVSNGTVTIGSNTPSVRACLDITSTTKGVVFPRMTSTQASAITAIEGLLLFSTDTNGTFTSIGYWAYENGVWVKL